MNIRKSGLPKGNPDFCCIFASKKELKMKIAIPTRDGRVDDHFGHCAFYTIATVMDNVVTERVTMPSPEGCGCKSNVAYQLAEDGVTLMLAGNMGDGALNKLSSAGIKVIRGCKGDIDAVLNDYLSGALTDSGVACDHHDCHDKNTMRIDVNSIRLQ